MTVMKPLPALHIRPSRNHLAWRGPAAQTWSVAQRAVGALLVRWRPAALLLTRTRFDEYEQPVGPTSTDRIDMTGADAPLNSLVDVSEVVAADPIEARVVVPEADAGATTLWFVDPDQRERQGQLADAPAVEDWHTRWFSADCPLQRGFVVYVPERGRIDVEWDRGLFAGTPELSVWKRLDQELDSWLEARLRELGFADSR